MKSKKHETVTVIGASTHRVYVKNKDGDQGCISLKDISHEFVLDASKHETIKKALKAYEKGDMKGASLKVVNVTEEGADGNFYSIKATIKDPYEVIKECCKDGSFTCTARKKSKEHQPQPKVRAYVELFHDKFDEPKQTWLDLEKEIAAGRIEEGQSSSDLDLSFEVEVLHVGIQDKHRRVFIKMSDGEKSEGKTETTKNPLEEGEDIIKKEADDLRGVLEEIGVPLDDQEFQDIRDYALVKYYLDEAHKGWKKLDPSHNRLDLVQLDPNKLGVILRNIPSVAKKINPFDENKKRDLQLKTNDLFQAAIKWVLFILQKSCTYKKNEKLDDIIKWGIKEHRLLIGLAERETLEKVNYKPDDIEPIEEIIKQLLICDYSDEPICPIWDEIIGNKDGEFWSEKIKHLREEVLELQQAEMATVLGTTPSSYQAWEDVTGRKLPDRIRENQIYFLSRLSDNPTGKNKLKEICETEDGRYYLASLLICFSTEEKPFPKGKTLFEVIRDNKPSEIANKIWVESEGNATSQ